MKKIFLSIIFCVFSIITLSQNVNTQNVNFLPSNVNLSELKQSDIPSEQVLRKMGLSDDEIKEALDFKYSKGVYSDNTIDSNYRLSEKINRFYKNISNDQILEDTLIFPKAKIYGQDIFRSNDIHFYQKTTNPNPPKNYEIGPGDQLSIAVWGNSDYTAVVKVDQGGYIVQMDLVEFM